nr:MAG TPA: hypothetical protein [Caudoviricetes sp.]
MSGPSRCTTSASRRTAGRSTSCASALSGSPRYKRPTQPGRRPPRSA